MNYTVTNEDAKKIVASKLFLIVPAALIGVTVGLSGRRITGEMLMVVLPIILLLVALSVFIGLYIAKKKLIGTQFIVDDNSLTQIKDGALFRIVSFSDQFTIKENFTGLIIKGAGGFIAIPKQISCYNEMKAELESRVNK